MDIHMTAATGVLPRDSSAIEAAARAEVKATLRLDDAILVATQAGLLRYESGQKLAPLPGLPAEEVRGLGPAPGGFVAVIGRRVLQADGTGRVLRWIEGPEGEKLGPVTAASGRILAGSKTGVFAFGEAGWTRLLGETGFEVIRIWEQPGRILVTVKKQGMQRLPALAESLDGGVSWTVTEMGDYGDIVVAADATRIVTKWRGARPRTAMPGGYKKHPITAAELRADGGVLVLDGDKAEIAGPGRRKAEIFHPALADAEHVHLLPEGILFGGVQGLFLFDPLRHRVSDLSAGLFTDRTLGKRKRLFALDGANVLATCSFGSFCSADGGVSWQKADSEWDVLDAERMARAEDGRWFLLTQRGLFVTRDNGARIDYLKPKLAKGVRHFGELRSLAVGAGRLWLGTKQGLFSAALDNPEHLGPVDAVPAASIEGLAFTKDGLLMAVDGHGLLRLDAAGAVAPFADVALHEASFVTDGATLLATAEDGLVAIAADGTTTDATPEGAMGGEFSLTAREDRILAWNRKAAWQKRQGGAWQAVPGFPAGVRSVALLPDGTALLTDRARVSGFSLPDAG
jgi:hypothetical protein